MVDHAIAFHYLSDEIHALTQDLLESLGIKIVECLVASHWCRVQNGYGRHPVGRFVHYV